MSGPLARASQNSAIRKHATFEVGTVCFYLDDTDSWRIARIVEVCGDGPKRVFVVHTSTVDGQDTSHQVCLQTNWFVRCCLVARQSHASAYVLAVESLTTSSRS